MLAMGQRLASPGNGDVEFECQNTEDGGIKKLYGLSTILSTRCAYYATSMTLPIEITDFQVFDSAFAEGDAALAAASSIPGVAVDGNGPLPLQRRRIIVED